MKNQLLSKGDSNAKTVKNNLPTYILYLSPFNLNSYGINVCPKASLGCAASCLNTAGRAGIFPAIQEARKRKTDFYLSDRNGFCRQLVKELTTINNRGIKTAIRLNGTSDLDFHAIVKNRLNIDLFSFKNLVYYDYTKILGKALKYASTKYVITFSRAENNENEAKQALAAGLNVSAVFSGSLPKEYLGHKVVDGDKRDDLMLKRKGVILGLKAKGKAKKDTTGFTIKTV